CRVAENLLLVRVPADAPPEAQRDISEVTNGGHAMAGLQLGDWVAARFDAIEKIADVLLELGPAVSTLILERLGPVRCLGFFHTHRSADWMLITELGDGIGRRYSAIRRHHK